MVAHLSCCLTAIFWWTLTCFNFLGWQEPKISRTTESISLYIQWDCWGCAKLHPYSKLATDLMWRIFSKSGVSKFTPLILILMLGTCRKWARFRWDRRGSALLGLREAMRSIGKKMASSCLTAQSKFLVCGWLQLDGQVSTLPSFSLRSKHIIQLLR